MRKSAKGITLVALVVTIIILLILATISIQALTNTGLFKRAQDAKNTTENAELEQQIRLNEYENALNSYYSAEVDNVAPRVEISLSSIETTTGGSITAIITQSDNQSGVNIGSCRWVYNTTAENIGTNPSSYTGIFTSTIQDLTLNSTAEGTYYLHVLSVDNAGNTVEIIKGPVTVEMKIPRDGLVAEYLFEENTKDTSGNGYDLSASNSTYIDGINGKAICTNASSYIYRNSNPLGSNKAFTISFYAKTNGTTSENAIFILLRNKTWNFDTWNANKAILLDRLADSNYTKLGFKIHNGSEQAVNGGVEIGEWIENTWYHFACSWDGNKGSNIKLYLNNKIIKNVTASYSFSDNWMSDYMLEVMSNGPVGGSYTYRTKGAMDQLRIYNRVLTDEEISSLYKEGIE